MSELKGGAWDGLKIVTEGAVNKGPRESESSLSMASCTEEDSLDTEALAAPDQAGGPGMPAVTPPPSAPGVHKNPWAIIPRSCAANVMPHIRPAMPSLEAISASPHYPVAVTPNPVVGGFRFNGSADPQQQLDINGGVIEVDGAVFKGKLIVHMDDLPTTDPSVFAGKKRLVHAAAQGRFKRRVRAAAICTGQEYYAEITAGSGVEWFFEQMLRTCGKVMSKTTIVNAHGDRPSFFNPLIAACQLINVAREGEEPDMWTAKEDCRLLAAQLSDSKGHPLSADKRRKWCDDEDNAAGLFFETDLVYTFHLWQDLLGFSSYSAKLGFVSFDLTRMLHSNPLQLMCKDVDSGDYLYAAMVWHERLLYPDEHAAKAKELRRSKSASAMAAVGRSLSGSISGRLRSLGLMQ